MTLEPVRGECTPDCPRLRYTLTLNHITRDFVDCRIHGSGWSVSVAVSPETWARLMGLARANPAGRVK
jgi:hypothetical protein